VWRGRVTCARGACTKNLNAAAWFSRTNGTQQLRRRPANARTRNAQKSNDSCTGSSTRTTPSRAVRALMSFLFRRRSSVKLPPGGSAPDANGDRPKSARTPASSQPPAGLPPRGPEPKPASSEDAKKQALKEPVERAELSPEDEDNSRRIRASRRISQTQFGKPLTFNDILKQQRQEQALKQQP
jgi:hypothetical protein